MNQPCGRMASTESPVAFCATDCLVSTVSSAKKVSSQQTAPSDSLNYVTSTPCFSEAANLYQNEVSCNRASLSDSGFSTIIKPGNRRPINDKDLPCPAFSLDSAVESSGYCLDESAATSVSGSAACDLFSSSATSAFSLDSGCLSGLSEQESQIDFDNAAAGILPQTVNFMSQIEVTSVPMSWPSKEQVNDHKNAFEVQDTYIDFIAELRRRNVKHILSMLFNYLNAEDLLR